MQHHQTLSYHQHNTQAQPPHASTYHSAFSYATTGLPVTPTEFGSADDAAAAITAAGPAAGGLPSPPYVCSPQQNHTDLGAYAAGALETGVSSAATTTTFPLQIVNEQGFGHGRMPPARSASNGSTWSVGSGSRSIGGGSRVNSLKDVSQKFVVSGWLNCMYIPFPWSCCFASSFCFRPDHFPPHCFLLGSALPDSSRPECDQPFSY